MNAFKKQIYLAKDYVFRKAFIPMFLSLGWLMFFLSLGSKPSWPNDGDAVSFVNTIRWLGPVLILFACLAHWVNTRRGLREVPVWAVVFLTYIICLLISSTYNCSAWTDVYYLIVSTSIVLFLLTAENLITCRKERFYILIFPSVLFLTALTVFSLILDISSSAEVNSFNGYRTNSRMNEISATSKPNANGISRSIFILIFFTLFVANGLATARSRLLILGLFLSCLFFYQSRGAALSGVVALSFIYLFKLKKFDFSLKDAVVVSMSACLTYSGIILLVYLDHYIAGNQLSSGQGDFNQLVRTLHKNDFSSGRLSDWQKAIGLISQQPFLGWGIQADRLLLNQTVSNLPLYVMLCGGLFSLLSLAVLGGLVLKKIANQISQRIKPEGYIVLCICIIVFLATRGLVESGFAVFGVDQLLALLCISILQQQEKI